MVATNTIFIFSSQKTLVKGFTVSGVLSCLLGLTLEVCLPSWPEGLASKDLSSLVVIVQPGAKRSVPPSRQSGTIEAGLHLPVICWHRGHGLVSPTQQLLWGALKVLYNEGLVVVSEGTC